MIFSNISPNLSYLGLNKESSTSRKEIFSKNDILSTVLELIRFNLNLDINTICLDISEFKINNSLFVDESVDQNILDEIKESIKTRGVKIYFFVGKDYFLGSKIDDVKRNTTLLLKKILEILSDIGINTPSIFIRIGSAYGNRKTTMIEFCESVSEFSEEDKKRFCVINDDKPSLFSVTDLLNGVYYETGIPIGFRLLPHYFNDGGLTVREAMFLSSSTWPDGIKPVIFYSESKDQDSSGIPKSVLSSDFLTRRIPTFGLSLDIIIESPMKEDSCLLYRMNSKSLPPIVINRI